MNIIKTPAKKILGALLSEDIFEWIAGKYNDMETLPGRLTSPVYRESIKKLKTFKDKHKGERCFIIGNGPSLNKTDLTLVKDEITFGLNRIYLLFNRIGFATTYFVSVNKYVIEQSSDEINKLQCPKFIRWDSRHFIHFSADTVFIRCRSGPKFCHDIGRQGVWEGTTVTYVAMQLAYYMGFSEVILVGVDHNFQSKGSPHTLVVSEGDDPDHFDPNYFGKDFRWQLPDLKTSETAYRMAKEAYSASGRKILDATVDGKLTVFPRVNYKELFRK